VDGGWPEDGEILMMMLCCDLRWKTSNKIEEDLRSYMLNASICIFLQ
jgi:hypothetical protein